jgi:hypothetical protein
MTLRLTIELVPESCRYSNLRKAVSRENWDIIRRRVYAEAGLRCAVCGRSSKLNCHEIWDYDDTRRVQTLMGFTALCDMCHYVKHLGFAQVLAAKGQLNYDNVIAHFCRVNKCVLADFREHETAVFWKWLFRSVKPWTTDLGQWKYLVLLSSLPKGKTIPSDQANPARRPNGKKRRIVEIGNLERDINL